MSESSGPEQAGRGTIDRRTVLASAAVGGAILAAGLTGGSAFAQVTNSDPINTAKYSLVIDGFEIAAFSDLESITSEVAAGLSQSRKNSRVQLATEQILPTAILRRGVTGALELWKWHEAVLVNLATAQKSATLIGYSTDGTPVIRFFLEKAWPARMVFSSSPAGSSEILYETVTLAADRIQRVNPT